MPKNMQNRKAVIYTRVSTDEQKENGFSLQDQYAKLLKYCEKNNLEVLKHYQDDHSAKTFNRPKFQEFLKDVKQKIIRPDIFLCVRPDRFSRNLLNSLEMYQEFKRMKIEFRTLENHTNLDSPESLLPFIINNVLPQIENERRGLNTQNGMRRAKQEGRTMGRPPIGYLNDKFNKKIIIDPVNAPLIIQGFEELSNGLYSMEEIRKKLIKRGLKNCCKQSFLNHIRNPYYYGLIVIPAWNDLPEEEVIGQHEPLITKELFDEVQAVVFGRKKNTPIKLTRKEELPLRGHLNCNKCGGKLTGSRSTSRNGDKHFYYHCQKGCKERFRADYANNSFEDYLTSFEISEEVLGLYKEILKEVFDEDDADRLKEIKQIDEKTKQINNKINSLQDKFLDNQICQEDYNSMRTRLHEERNEWNYKKEELSIDKSAFNQYFDFGLSFLFNVKEYYQNAELEIKQKIVGSIFPEKIIFSENKYRTTKTNELLSLLTLNINHLGEIKNGQTNNKIDLPTMAPSLGLEPRTL